MPQPRFPLRFNAGFLLHQPIGTSRDVHFDFPELRLSADLELKDFTGLARVSRTPQGLLVQGEFSGKKGEECVRCLADFYQPLTTNFDELFAFSHRSASESGLILPEDANIDLEPLVQEYFLIEVPINPICRPDCKGLCIVCGEDLNQTTCEHVTRSV